MVKITMKLFKDMMENHVRKVVATYYKLHNKEADNSNFCNDCYEFSAKLIRNFAADNRLVDSMNKCYTFLH